MLMVLIKTVFLRIGLIINLLKDTSLFSGLSRKNDLHIRIPVAFLGSGWGKSCGKIHVDLKAFGGLLMGCKSAVFWQSNEILNVFFTYTETGCFTGFPG
jgi:hypothetical protein